ncbi:uncharacterized protein LOC111255013 isoform X3 [Varroa destructor]|uniref:Uncharacterized protein n=1 Tax=Varroa destructor TaxID=109461 RepID=A0A7M7MJR9_VARDE|nr:uncharacterized protein LOC111255013 isoform X3 [Varroa destructor]
MKPRRPNGPHRVCLCYRRSRVEESMISSIRDNLIRCDCEVVSDIAQCTTVLVLLTPGIFEFIDDNKDPVRTQLSYALRRLSHVSESHCNETQHAQLIAIKCDLFHWPKLDLLPEDIRALYTCNAVKWSLENRDTFLKHLLTQIDPELVQSRSLPMTSKAKGSEVQNITSATIVNSNVSHKQAKINDDEYKSDHEKSLVCHDSAFYMNAHVSWETLPSQPLMRDRRPPTSNSHIKQAVHIDYNINILNKEMANIPGKTEREPQESVPVDMSNNRLIPTALDSVEPISQQEADLKDASILDETTTVEILKTEKTASIGAWKSGKPPVFARMPTPEACSKSPKEAATDKVESHIGTEVKKPTKFLQKPRKLPSIDGLATVMYDPASTTGIEECGRYKKPKAPPGHTATHKSVPFISSQSVQASEETISISDVKICKKLGRQNPEGIPTIAETHPNRKGSFERPRASRRASTGSSINEDFNTVLPSRPLGAGTSQERGADDVSFAQVQKLCTALSVEQAKRTSLDKTIDRKQHNRKFLSLGCLYRKKFTLHQELRFGRFAGEHPYGTLGQYRKFVTNDEFSDDSYYSAQTYTLLQKSIRASSKNDTEKYASEQQCGDNQEPVLIKDTYLPAVPLSSFNDEDTSVDTYRKPVPIVDGIGLSNASPAANAYGEQQARTWSYSVGVENPLMREISQSESPERCAARGVDGFKENVGFAHKERQRFFQPHDGNNELNNEDRIDYQQPLGSFLHKIVPRDNLSKGTYEHSTKFLSTFDICKKPELSIYDNIKYKQGSGQDQLAETLYRGDEETSLSVVATVRDAGTSHSSVHETILETVEPLQIQRMYPSQVAPFRWVYNPLEEPSEVKVFEADVRQAFKASVSERDIGSTAPSTTQSNVNQDQRLVNQSIASEVKGALKIDRVCHRMLHSLSQNKHDHPLPSSLERCPVNLNRQSLQRKDVSVSQLIQHDSVPVQTSTSSTENTHKGPLTLAPRTRDAIKTHVSEGIHRRSTEHPLLDATTTVINKNQLDRTSQVTTLAGGPIDSQENTHQKPSMLLKSPLNVDVGARESHVGQIGLIDTHSLPASDTYKNSVGSVLSEPSTNGNSSKNTRGAHVEIMCKASPVHNYIPLTKKPNKEPSTFMLEAPSNECEGLDISISSADQIQPAISASSIYKSLEDVYERPPTPIPDTLLIHTSSSDSENMDRRNPPKRQANVRMSLQQCQLGSSEQSIYQKLATPTFEETNANAVQLVDSQNSDDDRRTVLKKQSDDEAEFSPVQRFRQLSENERSSNHVERRSRSVIERAVSNFVSPPLRRVNSSGLLLSDELEMFVCQHRCQSSCYGLICPKRLALNPWVKHDANVLKDFTNLEILNRRRLSYLLAIEAQSFIRNHGHFSAATDMVWGNSYKSPNRGCEFLPKASEERNANPGDDDSSGTDEDQINYELSKIEKRRLSSQLEYALKPVMVLPPPKFKEAAGPATKSFTYETPKPPIDKEGRDNTVERLPSNGRANDESRVSLSEIKRSISSTAHSLENVKIEQIHNKSSTTAVTQSSLSSAVYGVPSGQAPMTEKSKVTECTVQQPLGVAHGTSYDTIKAQFEGQIVCEALLHKSIRGTGSSKRPSLPSEISELTARFALESWISIWNCVPPQEVPQLSDEQIISLHDHIRLILANQTTLKDVRAALYELIRRVFQKKPAFGVPAANNWSP